MGYQILTTRGNYYHTDDDGRVTARSNGPKGWDYSGKWIILGISKRAHSRLVVTLDEASRGEDFGQGWVHDLDHGGRRMWGNERVRSVRWVGDESTKGETK